ncbi:AraC family transcriptional regulator [Bacillus sp. J14TS2]|uniref:helix-turn-helix domain-containing protein n=1 Tax=Bacillus sp. J14TS2 TaxID=2807188 RepID=UPI001B162574|nr:AraC family transcriptional regulator [Bacillus sp. J14TS2]GIN72318.1 AraC family transcriptional regulator [Bacillus sp. J14TS2]
MYRNTKLFYKYFLSYMIIFLIPYITISIIFYNMSVSDLRDEIIRTNTITLEQVRELTDSRINELENIAQRISVDSYLTPYLLKNPSNQIQAIEQLVSYKVNSSIIDQLYLYYDGEKTIYSSQGTSTVDNFTNNIIHLDGSDFSTTSMLEDIDLDMKPFIAPMEFRSYNQSEHFISYIYPVSPYNPYSYGTVIFLVNEDTLTKLIENVLGDFNGNIYIFNDKDKLLASSSNGIELDINQVKDLALGKAGVSDGRLNNESFSLVTVQSEVSHWTFVTAMPTDQFYDKMSNLKSSLLLILSIIALFGLAASIWMSIRQYQPIHRLTHFIKNKQFEFSPNKNKNIIDNIRETIETFYDDSEQLQKKIEVHQPFIKDHFLLKLLRGGATILEDMKDQDLLNESKITFKGDSFFVIVVSFKENEFEQASLKAKEEILHALSVLSTKDSIGYGVELTHDHAVGIIINIQNKLDSPFESRRLFVNTLILQLQDFNHLISGIGVGKIYTGIDKVNRSYIESTTTLEFNRLNYNGEAFYFEDIVTHHQDKEIWYPVNNQNQAKFIHSLKQGDQIVAKETVNNIISDLKKSDISIHIFKCICFDIINSVLKCMAETGPTPSVDDVKSLVEFQSVEELEKVIHSLIVKTCREIQNRKESNNIILRDNILQYIKKHYKSYDISLESMAEKFQLTTSYLSRFIREQTGETFTQYLWNLRVNECKRQLLETDLPIKNIVMDIGYIDTANFTRKFKKEEGLTPGQYRKSHSPV